MANTTSTEEEPLPRMNAGTQMFQDLDSNVSATEIESLCMRCEENGSTKIMLTRIPHFKSIIILSFECPHCGFKNNEVQSGESIQEKGQRYELRCTTRVDLSRQIVRNSTSSVAIPELEFSAPPATNSMMTTVEGLISRIMEDLEMDQAQRKDIIPEVYEAVEKLLAGMRGALELPEEEEAGRAFTLVLDDPSGNSYVENLCAPLTDPKLKVHYYRRTREQMIQMGMINPDTEDTDQMAEQAKAQLNMREEMKAAETIMRVAKEASESNEILTFPANCSGCNLPCDTRMQMVDIPHFQQVIIMSTTCDQCGYKSNEVKCGGSISEKGKRITLRIEDKDDLSRDILKSETSSFCIPELDLDMVAGTLGGRFTTIEGLLRQVHDELNLRIPFIDGDSAMEERRNKFKSFLDKLESAADGKLFPLHITVDDPMAHSYIQNIYAPDVDPNMTTEVYERTFDQNEELGLNDINVEDYKEDKQDQPTEE